MMSYGQKGVGKKALVAEMEVAMLYAAADARWMIECFDHLCRLVREGAGLTEVAANMRELAEAFDAKAFDAKADD